MADEDKKENEEADAPELTEEELQALADAEAAELEQISLTDAEMEDKTEDEILDLKREKLAALKKKKKKKKIILIALVVILIGGSAGAFFGGLIGGGDDGISLDENDPLAEIGKDGKKGAMQAVFMDMTDMVVNLSSDSRRPHFINLKMTLEIKDKEMVPLIEAQMPRIIDAFNTYLREMRREDLQGSAGLYRLEHELMLRLQKTLVEGEVTDILFREIIIQ